jgi:predicted RNA-binding Zn-ribbon protein involved in translation (DUF1610 family)
MALIKCSECAKEVSDKAAACPNCGAPLNPRPESVTLSPAQPANILESLKEFNEHAKNITCLECGYVGMMGIKAPIVPWYASWWTIGVVIVVFALFGGAGFVFGIVLGLIRFAVTRYLVVCPSCRRELTTR